MDTLDPQRNRHLHRPRWLALVVVLLVACSPEASLRPRPVGPSPSPPLAPPSSLPTPVAETPSPSVRPSLPPTAWDQVFTFEKGALGDVIAWRHGLIAAGCIRSANSGCRTELVVVSSDGETWETIEVDAATDFGFGSLHRVGGRLFSLGYGHYGGSGGAVVWTSLDGRAWSRVRSNSFLGRAVVDIIKTPLGTFAIGRNAPVDSDNITGFLMWPVHEDGSFGTVRVMETAGELPLVAGAMWTGDEFLAWGGRNGPYPGPTNLLASPDGTEWTLRATIRGLKPGAVSNIVEAGDRLVAVGFEGRRYPLRPRVWTSDDAGRSWSIADLEGDDARIDDIEVEGSRLVARGFEGAGETQRPVSWTSTDGTTWERLPEDEDMPFVEGFSARARATIGDRVCVAGTFFDETPIRAVIYCR